jgi:radical SAM superfamily enzyme YgiQ (UPF0313 family)
MSEEEIYLISPPDEVGEHYPASQPLGLVSIATHADDNGYAGLVKVIDGILLSAKYGFKKAKRMIAETIRKEKPLITGFSTYNQNFHKILDLVKTANQVDSTLVFGGNYATTLHRVLGNVGIVVRSEGEETFVELLGELYNDGDLHTVKGITFFDGKKVVVNPDRDPIDINNISFPYWGFLPPIHEYHYSIPIEESRGCINDCSFCSINSMYKNKNGKIPPRLKTIERIKLEAEFAYLHGANSIDFVSELTLLNHERALQIADIMDGYGFYWMIDAHPRLVLKEESILPQLRKKGLVQVRMGVEAGSQPVLDYYNKQTTPEINSEAIKMVSKHDIKPTAYFINFHPDISMKELGENIDFIKEHLPHFIDDSSYPYENIFKPWIPIEGTPIYERLLKEKRIFLQRKDNPFGHKVAVYKDLDVVQVLGVIEHYLKHHQSTYEMIKKRIKKEIHEGEMNHSLAERNSRLKNIPFYVLSTAYSCAKDGKPVEESKSMIDSYCQQELTALSK